MLVLVTDTKGKDHYINAVYVKAVLPKGMDQCLIEISGRSTRLRVRQSARTVAEMLNASMPSMYDAILAAEDQQHTDQMAAVAAAAV